MSKDAKPATGLTHATGKNSLVASAPAGGPVVDMQEILPVIQSFQEHMVAEQARQRDRIRGLVTAFVLALAAALVIPLWAVRGLFRENQAALAGQRAEQAQTTRALEQALREVAESSRALRDELAQTRTMAPPPVMPEPAPQDRAPAPEPAPPAPPELAPVPPTPAQPELRKVEPAVAVPDVPTNRPVVAQPAPAPASAPAIAPVQTDLEKLLRQIEQSIADKQRQLQQRQAP